LKQILQNLSNGETSVVDVPSPRNKKSNLLIASKKTLVSAGTERMLVDFSRSNILNKAKKQPDKVKIVLNKMINDGVMTTIDAVRSKLDQPLPLGYCNAGVVLESDFSNFKVGDRVVSNGNHAEVVRVPKNLCVKIPDGVDDESAAFTVLGAVGLQGIRLIQPTIGECFVVTGLGLVGLICVQILRANGCRVLGIDLDSNKCELARKFGAETVNLSKDEDPIIFARSFSRGRGVDGVIVTASSESDEVMHQAAEMCRKRGRIVLVGVVGLKLRRDDFFKKELTFQVSASYGPGRYDSFYEEEGNDYPIGFVRWTEQRNFEAVLDMMDSGALDVLPLITHRYDIENSIYAYELLDDSSVLGILINYPSQDIESLKKSKVKLLSKPSSFPVKDVPCIGFIGAGNYSSRVLIPAFKATGSLLDTVVTSAGISGVHHGNKNSFLTASTNTDDILKNENINTIVIATRHDTHAIKVISSLNAGKHVFVEKPLALTLGEIKQIEKTYKEKNKSKNVKLMVGFNRRFAPHIIKIKELMSNHQSPKSILMTINAGSVPPEHWVHDNQVGGGRIIVEGCHFIDLMRHLVGHTIVDFTATMIGDTPGLEIREDKASITLTFSDGSFGTILYLANGGSAFPKERIEIFCDDAVLQLDNYRLLTGYGWPGFKKMKLLKQDKGQKACVKSFISSINDGKDEQIPFEETIESSRVSIEIANVLRGG